MILESWLRALNPTDKRVLVFAAGGGADIIFVRVISEMLRRCGATQVDLAQPLNRTTIDSDIARRFELETLQSCAAQVAVFESVVHNEHLDAGQRGKGITLAAAIEWSHGQRMVFAAQGNGPQLLARRAWRESEPYDMAIAVDGGGDILTGDPTTFDRIVLDNFRTAWHPSRPLALVVIGLGADGALDDRSLFHAKLPGWSLQQETEIDLQTCEAIECVLQMTNRLHPDPLNWTPTDPFWSRGLHVPQIVTLAARSLLPRSRSGAPFVLAPRHVAAPVRPLEHCERANALWLVLNEHLAKTVRLYCARSHMPTSLLN